MDINNSMQIPRETSKPNARTIYCVYIYTHSTHITYPHSCRCIIYTYIIYTTYIYIYIHIQYPPWYYRWGLRTPFYSDKLVNQPLVAKCPTIESSFQPLQCTAQFLYRIKGVTLEGTNVTELQAQNLNCLIETARVGFHSIEKWGKQPGSVLILQTSRWTLQG